MNEDIPNWDAAPEWAEWGAKDTLWRDHWFYTKPLALGGDIWRENQRVYPRPYRVLRSEIMRAGSERQLKPAYQGETFSFICPALEANDER